MEGKPLNERQLEVLAWVAAGCPAREWPDETHKHSARALANRGLVKVTRRNGVWVATPTDAGRHYAAHGAYPPADGEPATDAGGGSIPSEARDQLVPRRVSTPAAPRPRRPRTHPAVKVLREDANRLRLRKALHGRALRWLNKVAREAEHRSHQVSASENGIKITVRGYSQTVSLAEPKSRTRHEATAQELAKKASGRYVYIPAWDDTPSGRLRVKINGSNYLEDQKPKRNGLASWVIEDRVDAVLERVEAGAAAAEERQRRERDAYEERKRHWESVHVAAVRRWKQAFLLGELRDQAASWRQVAELGPYLEALARRIDAMTDPDERATGEGWLACARDVVERVNPLVGVPQTPAIPAPTHDDLRPFMQGLSPWGP